MKIVTCIAFCTLLLVGLNLSTHKAQAGLYDTTRFAPGTNRKISRRAKVGVRVRTRYRRRFGRRYARRISAFVRFGPYASRRSWRKKARCKH